MTNKETEIYNLNLVILGNFNPVIINPYWLASKNLIRESELETAKIEINHPEISRFELDWISVEATQNRIDFKTKKESHFEAVRDLVVSIFAALKETPVSAFGINHIRHYTFRTSEEYENFGYWFSPVKEFSNVMKNPHIMNVTYIEQGEIDLINDGIYRLNIAPSDLISDNKSIMIYVNHHVDNAGEKLSHKLMEKLNELWDLSFDKVNNINNEIWKKVQF